MEVLNHIGIINLALVPHKQGHTAGAAKYSTFRNILQQPHNLS